MVNQTVFRRKNNSSEQDKLSKLSLKAKRILFHAKTVFPFDFFPDEITIDENEIRIITRHFLLAEQQEIILLKDVHSVVLQTAPFFGTIYVYKSAPQSTPRIIRYLTLSDALHVRKIIQGLVALYKEGVDISQINMHQLVPRLEQIGEVKSR